jgi:hypothetical protein
MKAGFAFPSSCFSFSLTFKLELETASSAGPDFVKGIKPPVTYPDRHPERVGQVSGAAAAHFYRTAQNQTAGSRPKYRFASAQHALQAQRRHDLPVPVAAPFSDNPYCHRRIGIRPCASTTVDKNSKNSKPYGTQMSHWQS